MDLTLLILLAALLITYLAWRRAQRQAEEAREAQEAALRRSTYTLEPRETRGGRGFAIIGADGSELDPGTLSWSEHGLETVPVVGLEEHAAARRSRSFSAGRQIELTVEEARGGAAGAEHGTGTRTGTEARRERQEPLQRGGTVAVWDAGGTMQAGRVPAERANTILQHIDAGEVAECIVLWEERSAAPPHDRTGLLLLLIHRDIALEG